MEWLGQYIQAYKARFRNEVYLEDLTTTTETSVLVVDSVGLVSKSTSVGGDITGVDLTGTAPINIGSETNTTGGAYSSTIGIDIGNGLVVSSGDLEVKEDEIDHDSLDQYAANQHVVWANASQGTIHSSNIPTLNQNTTGQAATVATIAGLAPNTATTAAEQPAIESIGTDGDTLQILADELLMSNTTADAPIIKLINTTNDDQGSQLIFEKLRADDAVAVGQNVGEIWFRGQDAAQNTQNYGFILGEIDVSTSGQESGKVSLGIANHDGGNGRGLILTGGSENNEVDVTLGLGANSVVTVPGDIDLEGDIDVNGTLETDALTIGGATIAAIGTTAITTLGTIGTGVWNATAIASAKMATGTASAQGALELATTGEADTGTDTARAVTPAGLKSHVDANARKCILRHHAFYVNDNPMVQNNLYFGGNLGHQPSNWNDPAPLTSQTDAASAGVSGIIGDPDGYTFTIAKGDENWGMVLPFDISKVEVQCSLQPQLGTGDDFTVAIYTGIRPNDSAAVLTLTKVAHQSIAFSSGSNRTMINDVSLTADLAKNTMIYVGLGSEDNTNAKNGRGYLTVTVTER